jgi:hypothetical protein
MDCFPWMPNWVYPTHHCHSILSGYFLHPKDREVPKNYFTLNKKVEGGALVNLGKNERTFTSDELDKIKAA